MGGRIKECESRSQLTIVVGDVEQAQLVVGRERDGEKKADGLARAT